jgi:hypothetical protein
MRPSLSTIFAIVFVFGNLATAQEHAPQSKSVPDSINLIWKSVAKDFTALADAVPEEKWSFKAYARRIRERPYFRRAGEARCLRERSMGSTDHERKAAGALRRGRPESGKVEGGASRVPAGVVHADGSRDCFDECQ